MRICVLNGDKVNFDGTVDYGVLGSEVTVHGDCTSADYAAFAEGFDIIVSKELPISREDIYALPSCVKMIAEAGTGYNNIDLEACRERGIAVINVPAYSSERVAHTGIMLMLGLASSMRKQIGMIDRGDYSNFSEHLMVSHTELNGKTMGLIGTGHIGQKTIAIGRALDMNVIAYKPGRHTADVEYVSLDELLERSDYVFMQCPLKPETYHMIGSEQLAKMKPTAFIINTARGALIDESALIKALRSGKIAGAGLDVQENEPLSADSPLFKMENVIVTPHMGWKGLETRQRLVSILADGIRSFEAGGTLNRVDIVPGSVQLSKAAEK
jgi:glycerate dehydrogenase